MDVVIQDEQVCYLILKDNNLIVCDKYPYNDLTLVPPQKQHLPWVLPRAENVIEHYKKYLETNPADINKKLIDDLEDHFRSISELPNDYLYKYFAFWVIHTYLQEKIQYTPYIFFQGLAEKGKSRSSKGLLYVSYRGICIETLREAFIFRAAWMLC